MAFLCALSAIRDVADEVPVNLIFALEGEEEKAVQGSSASSWSGEATTQMDNVNTPLPRDLAHNSRRIAEIRINVAARNCAASEVSYPAGARRMTV